MGTRRGHEAHVPPRGVGSVPRCSRGLGKSANPRSRDRPGINHKSEGEMNAVTSPPRPALSASGDRTATCHQTARHPGPPVQPFLSIYSPYEALHVPPARPRSKWKKRASSCRRSQGGSLSTAAAAAAAAMSTDGVSLARRATAFPEHRPPSARRCEPREAVSDSEEVDLGDTCAPRHV